MTHQAAAVEMAQLHDSPELSPYVSPVWKGAAGIAVLPYGKIGLLPNPYVADEPVPPDAEFEIIYQDHDNGRIQFITGWSAARVLAFIKERAVADGLPWPEPKKR